MWTHSDIKLMVESNYDNDLSILSEHQAIDAYGPQCRVQHKYCIDSFQCSIINSKNVEYHCVLMLVEMDQRLLNNSTFWRNVQTRTNLSLFIGIAYLVDKLNKNNSNDNNIRNRKTTRVARLEIQMKNVNRLNNAVPKNKLEREMF